MELGTAGVSWIVFIATIFLLVLGSAFIFSLIYAKQREFQLKALQLEELERSERKYRGLFENAIAGILRFSYPSWEILEANKAALKLFQGASLSSIQKFIQAIPPAEWAYLQKNLSQQGFVESFQTKICTEKENELWVVLSAVAFPAEGYVEMVIIDITEKKRLEERNLRTQRIESIGIFASGLAHDLQNMLLPLKLSIDLLEKRLTTPDQKNILDSIRQGVTHGLEMVRHLLAFVRGAEGKHVPVELADFMRRLVRSVQDHLPVGIHLSVTYDDPPLYVLGDPVQLRQVFTNLINNACDAMPEGGNITIALEKCTLSLEDAEQFLDGKAGNYVKCSVSDTGCGIKPEILEKVFDPFFTTKEMGKGTGLGLSVVAGILKGHNGFVDVKSVVGKGTTFEVYFPFIENIS